MSPSLLGHLQFVGIYKVCLLVMDGSDEMNWFIICITMSEQSSGAYWSILEHATHCVHLDITWV